MNRDQFSEAVGIPCRIVYNPKDRYIDPSSGRYSGSRWNMVQITRWGIAAACGLIIGGFALNMSAAFVPASVIITGLATSNGAIYWASTRKRFQNDCEDK